MKLFLDTGNSDEIRTASAWGQIDGVTTNPSLIAKERTSFKELILEICHLVEGPVSVEALAPDFEGMMREAREYAGWASNVVIKLPLTIEGLKAARACKVAEIRTNITLCFSANQALLAARAGASFVSPFVGRVDDEGWDGMKLIEEIIQIYANYDFDTEILVASVRHPLHVTEAAKLGADVCTMPLKILKQLYHHPLTDVGIEKFMKDWEGQRQLVR
ncbi:MAG: fructose-6-phosphate aldolase [Cyanobacteria bacterium NC_groundwater_1444_Ag_S-0.65um_54_12]|nr:fructose-6-phosphate aldolase [Cyanobacteria bacterium NC_groundwater_1444_Ag_S-0.65um_54_12]